MRGQWGTRLQLAIFGESHGPAIGMVVSGLPPGMAVDEAAIAREMARRAPGRDPTATARQEADGVRILSGVHRGVTTGAPVCGLIENSQARSRDYGELERLMRPSHADYPAHLKYGGHNDVRGGGHFSGRLTAPLVFAGALARPLLAAQGVEVAAHIARIGEIADSPFDPVGVNAAFLGALREQGFPLLDPTREAPMRQAVMSAKQAGDSVGGQVECAAFGLPAGWGEPFFGSVESVLSGLLFAIPAVKAVAFGSGEAFANLRGSQANDPYALEEGQVVARYNHNGGVLGGITTGMPLIARVTLKPTPSIAMAQATVDVVDMTPAKLRVQGRHDPCIVPRAVPVVEAAVILGLTELMLQATRP